MDFMGLVTSGKEMEKMHFLCFQNLNSGWETNGPEDAEPSVLVQTRGVSLTRW